MSFLRKLMRDSEAKTKTKKRIIKLRDKLDKVSVPFKVLLALFLSISLMVGVLPINQVSGSELDKINQQIQNLENSVSQKRQQAKTLQNEITIIDEQVQQIELQIQATQIELFQVEAEITALNVRIEEVTKELLKQKDILAEHLQVLYEEGQTSSLEIVVSSENFSEFVNRSEYLETMQSKVKDTVDKIKTLKDELDQKKVELTTKQNRLVELKRQQEIQRANVNNQKSQKQFLLDQTKGDEATFQSQLKDLYAKRSQLSAQFGETVFKGQTSYPWGNPAPPAPPWLPDSLGYYIGECTSYSAWKRAAMGMPVGRNWGDAWMWAGNARRAGYSVNSVPSAGSVMVFPKDKVPGGYGHVAIVEAVHGDGRVTVSEYNWDNHHAYNTRGPISPTNYRAEFIH